MVRCIDCGCLSGRDSKTKELVEVGTLFRQKWETIEHGVRIIQNVPVCCKGLVDFQEKLGNFSDDSIHRIDVVRIIQDDIGDCGGFEKYQPGCSPTKVLDMIDQKQTQIFQDQQSEKARCWQAEQSALADKRQNERDERQREWQANRDKLDREEKRLDRQNQRFNAIIAAIVALVISLIGIAVSWFFHPR
jgi:hypothetical protein